MLKLHNISYIFLKFSFIIYYNLSVLHFFWIAQEISSNLLILVLTISIPEFFSAVFFFPGYSNWFLYHFYYFISTYFFVHCIDILSYFVSSRILTCLYWNSEIDLLFSCHLEWLHWLLKKFLLEIFLYDFTCLGILVFKLNLSERDLKMF